VEEFSESEEKTEEGGDEEEEVEVEEEEEEEPEDPKPALEEGMQSPMETPSPKQQGIESLS
jgi:hypothetical protein